MRSSLLLGMVAFAALGLIEPIHSAPVPVDTKKPKVEVVFCLDTTGSMSGLIEGAKAKIWAISNQIASGKPTPDLKIGLVAYRDRGDAYITQVFPLTGDLDTIHGELKKFQAQGGGDHPESVNQALHEAVTKFKWSPEKKTLKIIFLVGDAPPHMDYKDDVKYPESCKLAAEKGIIINTIQCGKNADCTVTWKDIASKAEGSYVAIPQDGGVINIATPYDKKLAALNTELGKTVLVFGNRRQVETDNRKNMDALRLSEASAAARVAYQAKNQQVASYCLLDQVKQGKLKLEEVKKEELPKELQGLKLKEQKEYLEKLDKKRIALNKEVIELDRQRSDYLAKKQAEEAKKGKAGFDAKVLEVLRNQAKKFEIEY